MADCLLLTDKALFAVAKHCANLHTLYASSCKLITDASVVCLSKAKGLAFDQGHAGLLTLAVNFCPLITDKSLRGLGKYCANSLQNLYFGRTKITDTGLISLMSSSRQLKNVDVHNCALTDRSIGALPLRELAL